MAKTPTSRARLPFQRTSAERGTGGVGHGVDDRREPDGREHGAGSVRRRSPVSGQTAFYLVLTALLAGYTVMAFGMEWQTTAGRVGPGLFPRIIGALGVAACILCLVQSLRADRRAGDPGAQPEQAEQPQDAQPEQTEQTGATQTAAADTDPPEAGTAEGDPESEPQAVPPAASTGGPTAGGDEARRHPWAVAALCAILGVFVTVMVPVGAMVGGSLALVAALLVCDRSHPVRSVLIGVAFPVVLYAVFVYGLNAQLPPGILPLY